MVRHTARSVLCQGQVIAFSAQTQCIFHFLLGKAENKVDGLAVTAIPRSLLFVLSGFPHALLPNGALGCFVSSHCYNEGQQTEGWDDRDWLSHSVKATSKTKESSCSFHLPQCLGVSWPSFTFLGRPLVCVHIIFLLCSHIKEVSKI